MRRPQIDSSRPHCQRLSLAQDRIVPRRACAECCENPLARGVIQNVSSPFIPGQEIAVVVPARWSFGLISRHCDGGALSVLSTVAKRRMPDAVALLLGSRLGRPPGPAGSPQPLA